MLDQDFPKSRYHATWLRTAIAPVHGLSLPLDLNTRTQKTWMMTSAPLEICCQMRSTNKTLLYKQLNMSQHSLPMQDIQPWPVQWVGSNGAWLQKVRAHAKDHLHQQAQAIQTSPSINTTRHSTPRYESNYLCVAVERRWKSRPRTRSPCGLSHFLQATITPIWSQGVRRWIPQLSTTPISVPSC